MDFFVDESSSSAALIARWRELRARGIATAVGSSGGSSHAIAVSDPAPVRLSDTTAVHYALDAEPGSYTITGSDAALSAAPEVMLGVSLVVAGDQTGEGVIVQAVSPVWRRLLNELAGSSEALLRLDARKMEELVAGAYREDGWAVTLTPRSGDKGRDVIAVRDDIGSIRLLDQVKRYAPRRLVTADEVRSLYGVLNLDQKASKAIVTTTSGFAPGVYDEFANVMPSRLDLRDGKQLRVWLQKIAGKKES